MNMPSLSSIIQSVIDFFGATKQAVPESTPKKKEFFNTEAFAGSLGRAPLEDQQQKASQDGSAAQAAVENMKAQIAGLDGKYQAMIAVLVQELSVIISRMEGKGEIDRTGFLGTLTKVQADSGGSDAVSSAASSGGGWTVVMPTDVASGVSFVPFETRYLDHALQFNVRSFTANSTTKTLTISTASGWQTYTTAVPRT